MAPFGEGRRGSAGGRTPGGRSSGGRSGGGLSSGARSSGSRSSGSRASGGAPSGGWSSGGGASEGTGSAGDPSGSGRAGGGPARGRWGGGSPGAQERRQAELEADPVQVARQVCLDQLAHGPRTRAELAGVLARREVPQEAADEVLGRLSEVGMIDDALFAQMWVSSRHRGRGLAGRALSQELRRKGVDDELVREAVDGLDPEQELATARGLVARRLPQSRGLPADARVRRLAGMLARKGYPAGLAFRVVREALAEEGVDPDLVADPDLG